MITIIYFHLIFHSVDFFMTNLTRMELVALDISDKKYLSWILDARIHVNAMSLGETIKERNTTRPNRTITRQ